MSNIRIIRASAGSGKTNSLVSFFLELLITETTDYFKHILAVTFTNKATEEMKGRIIDELDILSKGEQSRQLDNLMKVSHFKEEHIRNKASVILQSILHNYSWFSVETIDTFFQRIIKAFTRELGIPGNYTIEIEVRPVLQYAVDSLIDSLQDNPSLLKWMMDFSEERILEGKSWDFKYDLLNLGREVFKEEFSSESNLIFQAVSNKEQLNTFRDSLYQTMSTVEKQIAGYADLAASIIRDKALDDSDFFQKGRGIGAYLKKLQSKSVEQPNSFVTKLLDGPEYWPSGSTLNKEIVTALASEKLLPILHDIMKFLDDHFHQYNTSKVILRNLHTLGILSDLSEKISQYRIQRNSFLLSDSSGFINKIIDNNVAPFIYEKMGNRYNHFLIDEFQDTSQMQWKNLYPLIMNSISQGHDCLLVGDVKQSIYRWRNSNWEILAKEIHNDFQAEYIRIQNLKANWRSCKILVGFTNTIFPAAIEALEKDVENRNGDFLKLKPEMRGMISKIYQGIEQTASGNNSLPGHVKMKFFSKQEIDDDNTLLLDAFCRDIDRLLQTGYAPGDIAVLVRGKKEGKLLADHLIQQNSENRFSTAIHVISDESLFLSASDSVHLLVAGLRYLIQPDDDINRGKLVAGIEIHRMELSNRQNIQDLKMDVGMSTEKGIIHYLPDEFVKDTDSLLSLPLYELVERLVHIFKADILNKDVAYIHAFLDLVHDYAQSNPADIEKFLNYWEEEGHSKSVPAAESQNAIRILTIHKAKGLEFKAVLVPYCNWGFDQKANAILWTKPVHEDFNYLPLIPVNYTRGLSETIFAEVYYHEMFKSYIDNLNLLYVTLTRAEETLIVYPHYNESRKSNSKISTVGDLIYDLVTNRKIKDYETYYEEDSRTFEIGKEAKHTSAYSGDDSGIFISASSGKPAIEKLFFNPAGFDFLSETYKDIEEKKRKGEILHNILSDITTSNDIAGAVNQAIYKGLITQKESEEFITHFKDCLQDDKILSWFDGRGKIINETDIIVPRGEVRRPDRAVIFSDRIDVIDYKSGSESQFHLHKKQVRNYVNLIHKMGYQNVNGYIWYITSNKIMNVSNPKN